MVAHIIAKAAWQVLQPHAKVAAGHVVRGIGSLLSSGPKLGAPAASLPALNTHLLGTFAAPTAGAATVGTAGLAARHGRGVVHGVTHGATHGVTHHAPSPAGRLGHDAGVVGKRLAEDAAGEAIARPVADWAENRAKDMMADRSERKRSAGSPEPTTG
jgi:hypothetical protein